ncbi:MAG: hypothetical protein EXR81_03865 [Gammaproteobacteria bacterium]|nr:hypothetical protein [Gammaproteobacteria bacterium]
MRSPIVILSLLTVLLCSCSQPPKEDPKFQPVLDPHPNYFITYKGFIDPSLNHLVKLIILTVYTTTNPACEKDINPLEGVSAPRQQVQYTYVQPDTTGHFSYQLPMDKYLPGVCGWKISWANYNDSGSTNLDHFSSAVWFSSDKKEIVEIYKEYINTGCSETECFTLSSSNNVVVENKSVPNFKNHILEFNYYRSAKNDTNT